MNAKRVRKPRQTRSQKTLDRLAEETEALLHERRFDELSVAEIAERASSSVGAFYGRFPDKNALLHYLDERMEKDAVAHWDDFFQPERWRGVTLAKILRQYVAVSFRAMRLRKGVLTTVFLHLRGRPDPESVKRARRLNEHVVNRATELLLTRRREMGHPDPVRAIRFALFQFGATLREAVLFDDVGLFPLELTDDALLTALTESLLAYLRVKGPRR